MSQMRAHARMISTFGLALALIGSVAWFGFADRANAAARLAYDDLTTQQAAEIETIREDLALTNEHLTCMDLSDTELSTLFGMVRSWHGQNAEAWQTAKRAVAEEEGRVRHARSQLGLGQGSTETLANARAALSQKQTDYEALIDGLRQAILAGCSAEDRAIYANVTDMPYVPMP